MPEMRPVSSSNVAAVGYEPETQTLFVDFLNGGRYTYDGVPEDVFIGMLSAESVGRFLHQNVKGIYPYTKIG